MSSAKFANHHLTYLMLPRYLLVCGRPPFGAPTHKGTIAQIMKYDDDLTFPADIPISAQCKHFITSLLCRDPTVRLTASEAIEHVWIVNGGRTPFEDDAISEDSLLALDLEYSSSPSATDQLNTAYTRSRASNEDFDFTILDSIDITEFLDDLESLSNPSDETMGNIHEE